MYMVVIHILVSHPVVLAQPSITHHLIIWPTSSYTLIHITVSTPNLTYYTQCAPFCLMCTDKVVMEWVKSGIAMEITKRKQRV